MEGMGKVVFPMVRDCRAFEDKVKLGSEYWYQQSKFQKSENLKYKTII